LVPLTNESYSVDAAPAKPALHCRANPNPSQAFRDFSRCGLSIALLPDQRRGAIQAVSFVPIKVVNQNFVRQIIDDLILVRASSEDQARWIVSYDSSALLEMY